ncbi:MAG: zinc-dependent metalloprotease [Bacteroidia bacterium]|nr:zinc-dependent metalloprotease [Bacteroidia bacterium]
MKKKFIPLILLSVFTLNYFAQTETNRFWLSVNENNVLKTGDRQIIPQKYLTYHLNGQNLKTTLFSAPHERTTKLENSTCVIYLPVPNGSLQRFKLIESPIMEEALSAAYPQIKTFAVRGIDDPYASGRLDWNLYGFHGMVMSPSGDFFIDPYCLGNLEDYITYYTADFRKDPKHMHPEAEMEESDAHRKPSTGSVQNNPNAQGKTAAVACVGGMLRTYRLAVACTGEYAKAATGMTGATNPTRAQTLSKINTSVNRVDGVYETEVAVRLVLVANDTLVIFTNPSTDPFNGNNNANTLIGESQTVITNTIGTANFDIGHTFSTGGGGLANLGVVCSNTNKARGITGSSFPVGDPYDIDYVAHEMGHQFDGNHTFNATTGSCNGNRSGSTAVEPGSGVTIMGYAGICPQNNIANNSIAYFHAISYDEIVAFTQNGTGNSCPVKTQTGNNPPVVTVSNYMVPVSTPFYLTGSGSDPDGDKLSYSWEETDIGASAGNWNSGNRPFFRSYAPDTPQVHGTNDFTRFFPKVTAVISGNFTNTLGEYLPTSAQTLHFRLTARDKRMGGGGVCSSDNAITVDASGPFTVTYPSTTGIIWPISTQQNVLWDVNGTNTSPISCDSVRISISYNSGATYTVLVNSTVNDGVEAITVPTLGATISSCRIKVESIGNVFYDISNNNFTISTTTLNVGIKQVSADNPNAFTAWPNPFSDQINFAADNLDSKSSTRVLVLDMLGRTVIEKNYSGRSELKETLDLNGLNSGVYFITLSNNGSKSVHRLVKQ